jgi:hypothetical protein
VRRAGAETWTGTLTIDGPRALTVDLATRTSTPDVTPPTRPDTPTVHVISASRALVRWEAATDDLELVKGYLVSLDGRPAAITQAPGVFLGGLAAGTQHTVTVQAIDAAENVSSASTPVTFTTRAEDRGP